MTLVARIILALQSIGLDIKNNKTDIGTLTNLQTTDKTSLVGAINETSNPFVMVLNQAALPVTGNPKKIYIDQTLDSFWYWDAVEGGYRDFYGYIPKNTDDLLVGPSGNKNYVTEQELELIQTALQISPVSAINADLCYFTGFYIVVPDATNFPETIVSTQTATLFVNAAFESTVGVTTITCSQIYTSTTGKLWYRPFTINTTTGVPTFSWPWEEKKVSPSITVTNVMPTASQNGEWFNHVTGKAYAAVPVTGGGYAWAEQPSGDNSGNSNTRNGNIDGGNASTNYTGSTSVNGGNAFSVF